jgi:dihydroxyacetone kinase-like predicted kinase
MIAKRTEGLTPNTFIISGEIKKDGNNIQFHDVSSQYFVDNRCNMSQQMLKITVYEMMDDMRVTKDTLTKEQLTVLKKSIIDANSFTKATKDQINKANFDEFIQILESKTPGVKGPIYRTYIDMITDIMRDAFELIFEPEEAITVLYEKFKEYGTQKDMATFVKEKCLLDPPIEFDIYDNAECVGNRPKRSCAK